VRARSRGAIGFHGKYRLQIRVVNKRLKEGIARKGRFMPMKRLLFLSFLLLVISAQNVSAIPAGWTSIEQSTAMFSEVGGGPDIAQVDSEVFYYDSGPFDYVFTYQITNISDADLTWFSVTFDAVNVYEPSWDSDPCWVDPDDWYTIGSPPVSVEGIFKSAIGPSEMSALLWFKSDYGPNQELGSGALAGISSGHVFASGELIVPIPEPTSLLLFGAGGLVAVIRKRRPG